MRIRDGHTPFSIDYNSLQKYENYTRMILVKSVGKEEILLKLDLVNDIAGHYGDAE
ncbi:MAG: hypothetical protein HC887_11990 [Desulfobacteraceae bacterium]|nr:hypothetical protein [Desulfobacteraceae bacterium]